uniref:C-type lectin domain-containing protein n=1 Tax=Denticeps clupeoides TaxID=299321 RepID=A0AAY3ZUW1_9TELE
MHLILVLICLQKGCLLGWVFFKEKCYYVSTDEKNWENSRVECEEMGGHLLNIDNKDKLVRWRSSLSGYLLIVIFCSESRKLEFLSNVLTFM